MASGPQFNLEHEVVYGAVERISPLVQRVTCENPSRFTFKGTGTYIVGDKTVAIIDPGPPEDAHVDALVAAIDGRPVTHLLITHTHGDHSPGAGLLKQHIDAPTYGFGPHPLDRPDPDATSDSEDDDESGFGFDLSDLEEEEADKAKKDEEKDGYKAAHSYLDSLRLLMPRDEQVFYPTHGAPITDPEALVPALLAHREGRTQQILACLGDGIDTIKEMVLRMYTHVPKQLYNAAGASVMSHLVALHETGTITCSDDSPKPRSTYQLA